jgi:hypothetical protein
VIAQVEHAACDYVSTARTRPLHDRKQPDLKDQSSLRWDGTLTLLAVCEVIWNGEDGCLSYLHQLHDIPIQTVSEISEIRT